MNQTRKNWLLVLSLAVIAALIIFTTMGIFRGSPVIKVVSVIFDLVWLWSAYEVINALMKRKPSGKEEPENEGQENVTNSK